MSTKTRDIHPKVAPKHLRLAGLLVDSPVPQLLLRYGYAERMPSSLRRPLEDVLA